MNVLNHEKKNIEVFSSEILKLLYIYTIGISDKFLYKRQFNDL